MNFGFTLSQAILIAAPLHNCRALQHNGIILSGALLSEGVKQSLRCNRNLSAGLRLYTDPPPALHLLRGSLLPAGMHRVVLTNCALQLEFEKDGARFMAFPGHTGVELDVFSTIRHLSAVQTGKNWTHCEIKGSVVTQYLWVKLRCIFIHQRLWGWMYQVVAVGGFEGDSTWNFCKKKLGNLFHYMPGNNTKNMNYKIRC